MTNQVKIVPELRLPEFDGEWEEKILSQLLEIKSGKVYKETEYTSEGIFSFSNMSEIGVVITFSWFQLRNKIGINWTKLTRIWHVKHPTYSFRWGCCLL